MWIDKNFLSSIDDFWDGEEKNGSFYGEKILQVSVHSNKLGLIFQLKAHENNNLITGLEPK